MKIKLFIAFSYRYYGYVAIIFLFVGVLGIILIFPSISEAKTANNASSDDKSNKILKVCSSIYPIYGFVKKIGKENIEVSIVIPPNIEPHEFEPLVKQIRTFKIRMPFLLMEAVLNHG